MLMIGREARVPLLCQHPSVIEYGWTDGQAEFQHCGTGDMQTDDCPRDRFAVKRPAVWRKRNARVTLRHMESWRLVGSFGVHGDPLWVS